MTLGSQRIDTVLLKVASRCNLDCSYCYVYHMGDEAWRNQPKRMPQEVVERVAEKLEEQLHLQSTPFSVVLHGGEPLLLGVKRLDQVCARLRAALPPPCGIHMQTNGLLLNDAAIDVLVRYSVGVSISIDGPKVVHDRFRIDHRGGGSFEKVCAAIARIKIREDARPLFAGVLAVIDPESDPAEVYAALKATGAPSLDVLPRDGNWDRLPFGKRAPETVEYGIWLSNLMDAYLADPEPPRLRLLDDMLRLVLGGHSTKEGVGSAAYRILVIDTDGSINKNDTLKVAGGRADQFEQPVSIFDHGIDDILNGEEFHTYFQQQHPTSAACLACPDLGVCGGGMVAHRWSAARRYENPTIFCSDQRYLIAEMRRVTEEVLASL